MWPFKSGDKRDIIFNPRESIELNFLTAWRIKKNEVMIITDKGQMVLDQHSELIIQLQRNNIDPIKLKVVPDFKNKVLNFVEIIDPNEKRKPNDPSIFSGSIINERKMNFEDYLEISGKYQKKIEKILIRFKWTRNIIIPINLLLALWNFYSFFISADKTRYINLIVGIFQLFCAYYFWNRYNKYHKDFEEYKEVKEKIFGIVRER